MPPAIMDVYLKLKASVRTPFWAFTGVVLAFIGVILLLIFTLKDNKRIDQFVANPKQGDIFEMKEKSGNYTLFKIKKIEHDTVYFYPNKYETSNTTGLSDLLDKGDTAFVTSTTYGVPISKLIQMRIDQEIFDVDRK